MTNLLLGMLLGILITCLVCSSILLLWAYIDMQKLMPKEKHRANTTPIH